MRVRMIPAAWLLLSIACMWVVHRFFPLKKLSLPAADVFAYILFVLSALIFVAAAWQFNARKTTVDPLGEATSLITGGPFRLSRNPIYLAMVLILCGVALRMGSATPWLIVVGFIWIMQIGQISREERQLEAKFGDAYAEYCERVRRWL